MAVSVAMIKDTIRQDGALIPHVVQRTKIDFEKLLSFMGRTTGLSETDIRSVFLQFAEALVFYLPDGSEVQTPVGAFKVKEFSTYRGGIYQWSTRNLPLVQRAFLQWSRPILSVVNSSATTEEFLLRNWSRRKRPGKCRVQFTRHVPGR